MREQYSSYDECLAFFDKAQKERPNLFKVDHIGKTWEDRDIIAVTISKNVKEADTKPALFYTGSIHAREWVGIELSLAFAEFILDHIDFDPQLNSILTNSTLYMVPCANPDGFEYSREHFSFWRKNRRQNADGSFGVDLNRNFSVGFTPNKNTSSNVYSGPSAFSEPETLALKNFVEDHSNITIALDYHSQGNVFFPAHNFIHEDAIDATDLNTLAANMAEEIKKYSDREYGIHMGKPPTHLISGSGREFYYSHGALALVVEVGTRNISDYKENMREHVQENIPALVYALKETPNYNKSSRLKRVQNFLASEIKAKSIKLTWDYDEDDSVYFEIYRSSKLKSHTQADNRVGITKTKDFLDEHIRPSTNYNYFIRAVCEKTHNKSPFAPVLTVRTQADFNMFSKILFPLKEQIGYVSEVSSKNSDHFGVNSMFVGVSENKGECFGVCGFSLNSIPSNAIITDAKISFYPLNRVSVQVEKFGEWRVGMIDEGAISSISSFKEIKEAKVLSYVDRPTSSHQLSQGVWRTYKFFQNELNILQDSLKKGQLYFRMDGPKSLPLDRSSQLMQWDIGYGQFSGGLTFRPKLDISYTIDESKLELNSVNEYSINAKETTEGSLLVGYDKNSNHNLACMQFDLNNLPDMEHSVISKAYIELEAVKINANTNIRFHLEMVNGDNLEKSYKNIKNRDVIERVGYDVSAAVLKTDSHQRFVFDTHTLMSLVKSTSDKNKVVFVISSSSEKSICKSQNVNFIDAKRALRPKLILEYMKKRRHGVDQVKNLKFTIENSQIRLSWDNPKDEAFRGVIVVKNPFHIPCSPYDGQKLYGGSDNYTFDNFGDRNTSKYYAVFTYDNVPNFSEASHIHYNTD